METKKKEWSRAEEEQLEKIKTMTEDRTNRLLQYVAEWVIDRAEEYDELKPIFAEVLENGCQSGIVSELIYYTDTHKFFDTYYEEIMELRDNFSSEMGESINPPDDTDLKNWFAWFAFEETLRQIANSLDIEV